MGLYWSLCVFMGPYGSLKVIMDFNGFLWVLVGPYLSF